MRSPGLAIIIPFAVIAITRLTNDQLLAYYVADKGARQTKHANGPNSSAKQQSLCWGHLKTVVISLTAGL